MLESHLLGKNVKFWITARETPNGRWSYGTIRAVYIGGKDNALRVVVQFTGLDVDIKLVDTEVGNICLAPEDLN